MGIVKFSIWLNILSILMILHSLSVIRLLICGNNLNWLLNLNLIYETQWTGVRNGFLISMLGKVSCFFFDRSSNNGSVNVKLDGSVFDEKPSFKMLGLTFPSLLNWSSLINLPYTHVWNTVFTSGLVPLVASWNC